MSSSRQKRARTESPSQPTSSPRSAATSARPAASPRQTATPRAAATPSSRPVATPRSASTSRPVATPTRSAATLRQPSSSRPTPSSPLAAMSRPASTSKPSSSRPSSARASSHRPSPPPSPVTGVSGSTPKTVDYDLDICDPDSWYDRNDDEVSQGYYFTCHNRRMARRLRAIKDRPLTNTRFVSLETLKDMGLSADFLHLTCRVGFEPAFWTILEVTFKQATLEILSSLRLKTNPSDPDRDYIKFRVLDHPYKVTLTQIRKFFGFLEPGPVAHMDEFREGHNRESFWGFITGDCHKKRWKIRHIQHPLLRVLHRAIATTIYGRVSTLSSCTTNDLILMDFMLRPETTKLDLARLMVEHWISVRDQREQSGARVQGPIAIGSLLTHLAKSVSASFSEHDAISPTWLEIDFEHLISAQMVRRGSTAATRDTYYWQLEDRPAFPLPYTLPFDLRDTATYLIPAGYDPDQPRPTRRPTRIIIEENPFISSPSASAASSSSGQATPAEEHSAEEQPTSDRSAHSTPLASPAQQPEHAPPSSQPDQPAPAASISGEALTMLQHLTAIVLSNQMDLQALKLSAAQVLSTMEQLQANVRTAYDRLAGIDSAIFQLSQFNRYGVWPTIGDIPSTSATPSSRRPATRSTTSHPSQ